MATQLDRPRRRPPRPGTYRAVVFDLDGTLVREANSWAVVQRKLGPDGHRTARERWRRFRAGLISRERFLREQVSELRGREVAVLDELVAELEYHEGVAATCAALRTAGVRLAIVSSGLSALAERVATDLDVELHRANELHVDGGRFTGEATLRVPVGDKGPAFCETVTSLDVPFETVVAVGDGTGDADMFRLAGLGVAFCPLSFEVEDAADAVIDVPDMRHLLPLVLG